MKRKKNKTDKCLNCGKALDTSFEYCPACGQENNDRQLSFGHLFADFFANYFSFDSRFGRSIYPFFLQPGKLTTSFMEGKRVHYANPIRLYLILSLIHFFFLSLSTSESDPGIIKTKNSTNSVLPKNVDLGDDLIALGDSNQAIAKGDTLLQSDTLKEGTSWPLTTAQWALIRSMTEDKSAYSVDAIADSIGNAQNPYVRRKINRQIIKLMKSDLETVNQYLLKNIPIMMFFLLPVFALWLKVFFRKRLYINHLVHGLHLHCFAFVVLTVVWISDLLKMAIQEEYALVLILIYTFISIRNTYRIKWKTAIGKTMLLSFTYGITMALALFLEVLISLLIY